MTGKQLAATEERNESNIFLIRGQKVMLGAHLAEVYEIEPQVLVQAVERNIERFPEGSVFQLNPEEIAGMESRPAISTTSHAFTKQGVAMLSCILFDERAVPEDQESCAPTCSCRR